MVSIEFIEDKKPYVDIIEEIVEDNKEDFNPYGRYIDPDSDTGIAPGFFENFRKPVEDMLIAKVDGEVVGFVCIHLNCDRKDYPIDAPYTLISLILIDSQYRGQGIGHKLHQRILDMYDAGRLNSVMISGTWEGNNRQRHMFEKFGFEIHSKKQNHRSNGDDTVYYVYQP